MRFSNFLFPESRDPARDGAVIDEVMQEVQLSERLGVDTVWLSEHHFDGNCAYVDPIDLRRRHRRRHHPAHQHRLSPSPRCPSTTPSASPNNSR